MKQIAIKYDPTTGLAPAVIQDQRTGRVLMLGYMNKEALSKTIASERVTFYSRSKKRLWTKGESSGNFLKLVDIKSDCDTDTLLILAIPAGPICHTGADTCWQEGNAATGISLDNLQTRVRAQMSKSPEESYTASLIAKGINKVAQKVGEEAVELVIEAKDDNKQLFLGEAADLMYHFTVLLAAKGYELSEVMQVLEDRIK